MVTNYKTLSAILSLFGLCYVINTAIFNALFITPAGQRLLATPSTIPPNTANSTSAVKPTSIKSAKTYFIFIRISINTQNRYRMRSSTQHGIMPHDSKEQGVAAMGQQYSEINDKNRAFIEQQKIFFVGTATADSRVNISPKGMDSLRVMGPNRIAWLNVTGSGNETAAHVQIQPRMTIMFAAFEGKPNILRLYGHAEVIHHNDPQWPALYSQFPPLEGARQIFDMRVDLVQNSCGLAVPFLSYDEDRNQLREWAQKQGDDGLRNYWQKKNQTSIDGIDTHIVNKNLQPN